MTGYPSLSAPPSCYPRLSEAKPSICSRNAAQSVTGLRFLARRARDRRFQMQISWLRTLGLQPPPPPLGYPASRLSRSGPRWDLAPRGLGGAGIPPHLPRGAGPPQCLGAPQLPRLRSRSSAPPPQAREGDRRRGWVRGRGGVTESGGGGSSLGLGRGNTLPEIVYTLH